jgi:hypothetical protein
MASLLLTEALSKLKTLYKQEHNKLGQLLLDKSPEGKESSNWQGGKVNGFAVAIETIQELEIE